MVIGCNNVFNNDGNDLLVLNNSILPTRSSTEVKRPLDTWVIKCSHVVKEITQFYSYEFYWPAFEQIKYCYCGR